MHLFEKIFYFGSNLIVTPLFYYYYHKHDFYKEKYTELVSTNLNLINKNNKLNKIIKNNNIKKKIKKTIKREC
jgi:hypothetical protein